MLIDPDFGQAPIIDRASTRRDLSLIIERAIEALDAMDGDLDFEPDDDAEDDDPAGCDILDEPHDPADDLAADPDAAHLLRDEFWFGQRMYDTREERRQAAEQTLQHLANITGRPFQATSFPRVTFYPPRRPRGDVPLREAVLVNGVLVEVRK
ncbi:hypothetical protein MWN33_09970 [Starkeya koreensis]|uniref:Uncharacterized protein n=1 Tax=Ancylobacter koreensis TaxID=266121 RepID=A0ABT0DM52_9HYPH|nr:hypothetical protein [Ancylobacter koreensis]MCK0208357.1 hypothetical protein [Ancylobacter koreensis]